MTDEKLGCAVCGHPSYGDNGHEGGYDWRLYSGSGDKPGEFSHWQCRNPELFRKSRDLRFRWAARLVREGASMDAWT